jgi:hypothetical protein
MKLQVKHSPITVLLKGGGLTGQQPDKRNILATGFPGGVKFSQTTGSSTLGRDNTRKEAQ